jgi:cytochrome c oxidase assembly factor CtaG
LCAVAVTPSSPWTFHLHAATWLVVGALAFAYAWAIRRTAPPTRRQITATVGGLVLLAVALTWPLADLAAHWSLTALVCQRLLVLLAVPPLLMIGLPPALMARVTRPAAIDSFVRRCARPPIAVGIVTVIAVATLTTPAVAAQGASGWARLGLDLALLVAGFVLWTPVLTELPGTDRPSALGRAGYLIVQSIVPSFLAVVWIFARHPLYPHFANGPRLLGASPLTDQQVAGFVAKFATIAVLWTVAFVSLARAQHAISTGADPDPLLWSDVERLLERDERRERRRRAWLPPIYHDPPTKDGSDVDDRQRSTPPEEP